MGLSNMERQIELHKDIAPNYDIRHDGRGAKLFQNYWNDTLIRLLPKGRELKVLEIGCGTGILLKKLSSHYKDITGLDISEEMLSRVKKFKVVEGNASNTKFKTNTFDIVIARGVLHHMVGLDKVLKEIRRILKPNGVFLMSEPCNDNPLVRWVRSIMYKGLTNFDEEDEGYFTLDLIHAMWCNGFMVEGYRYYGNIAYIWLGFPDILKLPFRNFLAPFLIWLDKKIKFGLHIIVKAQKI